MTEVDASLCPLCGGANDCGRAAGRSTCWCFEVTVPRDVLARVPAEQRGVVCICRRCGDGTTDAEQRRRLALRWTRR
ncbi:MAG: cysteine-rich CWC family protein [Deltaproteobacteria bacterium]|nr:cysteine-rich CWC family protein [Deltaproteobacteria bacterium]MCW5802527.1 cysteine-rich CWC family protein [Deltaproteobacteria bacterium]